MNIQSAFAVVSVTVLSMTLHQPQTRMELSQQNLLTLSPIDAGLQLYGEEEKQPLLLAGNTACNPRVTVCEE